MKTLRYTVSPSNLISKQIIQKLEFDLIGEQVEFFEELALMQCVEAKMISVFTKISILHELCNLKATLIRALNSIFYNSRYN